MNDSFVFYKSFYNAISLLPSDSEKLQIYEALFSLAFKDQEVDLSECSDNVKIIYYVTSEQIKASIKHKMDGLKGGRPKKETSEITYEKTSKKRGVFDEVIENKKSLNESNVNVNVNDNDNVNDNVNANGENAPSLISQSQTKLSKKIFNIFKDADLPCCKGNEISFLMQDFTNGMSYLHKTPEYKHIHSDDLIGAIKNYISTLEDPETYVTCKMDFFTLVKSKTFYAYLPANYEKMNFQKFGKKDQEEKPKAKEFFYSQPCPKCNKKKLVWINDRQKYECRSCGSTIKSDEVFDETLNAKEVEEWEI